MDKDKVVEAINRLMRASKTVALAEIRGPVELYSDEFIERYNAYHALLELIEDKPE